MKVTPEWAFLNRRQLMAGLGAASLVGCRPDLVETPPLAYTTNPAFPGGRSPAVEITPQSAASTYNNFYEFGTDKSKVHERARGFVTDPWTLEVDGACSNPRSFSLDDLRGFQLEERVYRFRCVEAWAMVVPWIGFPLARLLDEVAPTPAARWVRFESFGDPTQMPGIDEQPWYPWPYFEALRLDEAENDLSLLAMGIYGHALPPQHGAPIRLVVPWKYGYKSIKSLVRITLTEEPPGTFWNELVPEEYDVLGNVRPDVPHPRWSQATERMLPNGERVPTRMYNGYAGQVAHLYS